MIGQHLLQLKCIVYKINLSTTNAEIFDFNTKMFLSNSFFYSLVGKIDFNLRTRSAIEK